MEFTHELDCRRLLCPMPVIRTQNRIADLADGDVLKVVCTDPGALHDIPAWCRVHHHAFLGSEQHGSECVLFVRVCKPSAEDHPA